MMDQKVELFSARVSRILRPDLFEAQVHLGFDISVARRFKLSGVDSEHVRTMSLEESQRAVEFLRSRIEGQRVVLRTIKKGEHHFARVSYGPGEQDVLEEMDGLGLLRRYEKGQG